MPPPAERVKKATEKAGKPETRNRRNLRAGGQDRAEKGMPQEAERAKNGVPKAAERAKKRVLSVAEREKKATAKAGKPEKPEVLAGTAPTFSSTTAIAQLLGKTVRRVQQLTQEGVLETEVPPSGGARKYRTCETVQRYITHIERKAQETGAASRTAELNLKKLQAEVDLKESQGELHRMKTAIAKGDYIPAEQATEELADFMARFKTFSMAIPSRVSGTMAAYLDTGTARAMEKKLRSELEAMLTVFVNAAAPDQPPEEEP